MVFCGSISGELDIRSQSDEFIKYFTRQNNHVFFSKENGHDVFPAEELRFQIESKDLENRTVTMNIIGNQISERFKTVKATFTVTPREGMILSRVALTVEFEKVSDNIEDRLCYPLARHIRIIDANLYELNHMVRSIDAKYPADECFKTFIEAFKDDADMEVEAEENMTTTIRLRRTKFNSLKVTTTITPQEDGNGNHVKWTIEVDKISDYIKEPDLSCTVNKPCFYL